ncbi:MAG: helix-hairpin-helix domain-containing protein [Archangium sp.]
MTRPAAIAIVLVIAGVAGLIAWWRVPIDPARACPDGGVFTLGPDGVARCGEGAALPPGQAMTVKQKFDCNLATAEELALVPGLGASVAAEIVAARPDGGFTNWDEIDAISGVGPARLIALQAACEFKRE